MDWSRVPLLLVTAFLLVGGITDLGTPATSEAMIAVGFTMLGAWASIEIQSWYQRLRRAWEHNESLIFEQVREAEKNGDSEQSGL